MAQFNRASTLRAIRERPGQTRAQISRRLSLTATALTTIANDLLEVGIIREEPGPRKGPGRPGTKLVLNPDWAHVIAVTLTAELTVGMVDLAGRLVHSDVIASEDRNETYRERFDELVQRGVKRLLQVHAPDKRLLGMGVISFGRVRRDGVIARSYRLPRRDLDMRPVLAPVTDLPVRVDEEFRLLLLAYLNAPDAPAWGSAVAMSGGIYGHGGSHALFTGGAIHGGRAGFAGDPGHQSGLLCSDQAINALKDRVAAMGGLSDYIQRLQQGDKDASEIYDQVVFNYGYRLARLVSFYDPDGIVIYSPYAVLGEAFLDRVREVMRAHAEPYHTEGLEIRLGGERTTQEGLVAAATPILLDFFQNGEFETAGMSEGQAAATRSA